MGVTISTIYWRVANPNSVDVHPHPYMSGEHSSDCNMVSTERVTIRITKEQLLLIQNLIDSGKFDTMTDVVKGALDEFLGKYFSPENIQKVTVDLPKGNMIQLEELVRDGDSISIDDAIRNAVREYTRNRVV